MIAQRSRPKIYLAGPDVFRKNAEAKGLALKALAKSLGFDPLWPLDNDIGANEQDSPRNVARSIFHANAQMIQKADAVLANIEPFRGPGMDPGTAWEIGCAWAWNKPVFAYSMDGRTYAERVLGEPDSYRLDDVIWHPSDGMQVENFGLIENLMISCSAKVERVHARDALRAAARHFQLSPVEE